MACTTAVLYLMFLMISVCTAYPTNSQSPQNPAVVSNLGSLGIEEIYQQFDWLLEDQAMTLEAKTGSNGAKKSSDEAGTGAGADLPGLLRSKALVKTPMFVKLPNADQAN